MTYAWRGSSERPGWSEPGELAGYARGDAASSWSLMLKRRIAKYSALTENGFDLSIGAPALLDQLDENTDISVEFLVLRCVEFDGALLRKWVDRRNGIY